MTGSIFLLNPPSLPGSVANREGSAGMGALGDSAHPFIYPPHLLATAGAALAAAGWRVAGLDAAAQGLDTDATLERLPRSQVLALPVSFATQAADRAFLNRLRERQPLARVLAIGPALSYAQVDHVFSDLVDALLMGEPELALPAAAARLLAGELIPGRAVNPYTLAPEHYTPDGLLATLDALPMPAWELFHGRGHRYPFLSVLSSRGCPAGCRFCPYVAAQGALQRCQSPARTVEELLHTAQRHQVTHIMLRDPVFALERDRVLAICSELRRRQQGVTWECESRPEHFDGRLLRALHDAGCTTVKLGLESADPDLLVAIGRVADEPAAAAYLAQVAAVVQDCHQLGMSCRLFVMVGLPNETERSLERTAQFLRTLRPIRLHVKPFHWYPGIALPPTGENELSAQIRRLQDAVRQRPSMLRRVVRRLRARAPGLG
ncbi:MAG: radical SAM protein [Anaerolinea sp.]|nr:radical SAM protein [Anaerolinea sp.]